MTVQPSVAPVLGDRERQAVLRQPSRLEAVRALHPVPAEVQAALAGARDVDLLPRALADVADPQVARLAIERQAPRVAQAVVPDLVRAVRRSTNGLSGGMP